MKTLNVYDLRVLRGVCEQNNVNFYSVEKVLRKSGLFDFTINRVMRVGDKYHNAFHGYRYVVMYNRNSVLSLWNVDKGRWSNSDINNFDMIAEGWPEDKT